MRGLKEKLIVALSWIVIWITFNKMCMILSVIADRSFFSLLVEGCGCVAIAQFMCISKKLRWIVLGMLVFLLICQFNLVNLVSFFINVFLFMVTKSIGPIRIKVKTKKCRLAKGHVLR